MHDFNYYLEQFSYTEDQKKKIVNLIDWLKKQSLEYDCPNLFINFQPEFLDNITLNHLQELAKYKSILNEMEDIHYKTIRSIEYRSIEHILKLVPEKIDSLTQNIPLLEASFKAKYSQICSESEIFQKLYTYQEFKDQFNMIFDKNYISVNKLNEYKKSDIFEACRQNIMKSKVELETSFQEGQTIHLDDLKPFPKLYNLIACEFFHQYTKESLEIENFSGNHLICELIRPSHALAKQFNLEVHESALLSISLNPIANPNLCSGDLLSYFDLMFEIKDDGESYKLDIFWPLKLSSKTYYIQAKVYFNHHRLQLISGQRSSHWRKSA